MAIVTFEVDQQSLADAAAGGGGGVIPEGRYILRYTEAKFDAPKQQGGSPKLVLKCEIMWSEHGGSLGKKVTRRLSMSPKAIPYFTIPFLQAAGVPVQQDPRGGIAFDPDLIVGTQTKATCSHSKGEQRTFEDWTADEAVVNGAAGVPATPPPAPAAAQGFYQPPAQPAPQAAPLWQQPQQPQQTQQFPVQQPAAQQPMGGAPQPQWQQPQAAPQPAPQAAPGQQSPWNGLPPRGQG